MASPADGSSILNVSRHLCWGGPHPYENLSALLTAQIYRNTLYTSDPRHNAWPRRLCSKLAGLQRAMKRGAPLPPIALAIYPHDDCLAAGRYPLGWPPILTLSYGVASHCGKDVVAPIPWIPDYHNPLFAHLNSTRKTRAKQKLIEHAHPWTSKHSQAVWRGAPTDGSALCQYNPQLRYCNADADTLVQLYAGDVNRQRRGKGSGARLRLVLISQMYPGVLDAQFTTPMALGYGASTDGAASVTANMSVSNANVSVSNSQPSSQSVAHLGGQQYRLPFEALFGYRYVVDVQGNGYSARAPSLLLGNSVVVLQRAYRSWWSTALDGAVVHVKADLSDLVPSLRALEANQTRVLELVRRMKRRVHEGVFSANAVDEAWRSLLVYLAKRGSRVKTPPDPAFMRPLSEWHSDGACTHVGSRERQKSDECRAFLRVPPRARS